MDRGLLFDSIPAPAVHGTSLKVALALAMVCKGCELKFLAPCSCNKCDPTWLKRIASWYKTNTNNWYCCHCVQKGEWSVKIHDAHKIKKDYLICDEAFQYAFEWQTRVTPCRATDSGDQGAAGSSWPSWDPPPPPGQVRKTKKRPMTSQETTDLLKMKALSADVLRKMYGVGFEVFAHMCRTSGAGEKAGRDRWHGQVGTLCEVTDPKSLATFVGSHAPPIIDTTWGRSFDKPGLYAADEKIPKKNRPASSPSSDCLKFVEPSTTRVSNVPVKQQHGVYRYDRTEQTANASRDKGHLGLFLSFLSWNAGPSRQQLDQANFMAKSFAFIMVQEHSKSALDQLGREEYADDII